MTVRRKATRIGIILLLFATMTSMCITETNAAWWEWITGDVYYIIVDQSYSPGMQDNTSGTVNDLEYSDNINYTILDDHAGMVVYIYTKVAHGYSRHIKMEFDRNDFCYYGPVGYGGGISVFVRNYNTGGWNQKAYVDSYIWSATYSLSSSEYTKSGSYDYTIIKLQAWSNAFVFQLHIDRAVIRSYVRI